MKPDIRDFMAKGLKFAAVGAVGVVVNLAVLYLLVQYFSIWYLAAELVAIVIAFATNYLGNILIGNIKVKGINSPDKV